MAVKSTFKNMTLCLGVICVVCSGLLAGVYAITKDAITKAAADKLTRAIAEVVPPFADLSEQRSISFDGKDYPYYLVFDEKGNTLAAAITSTSVGFGGALTLMVGITTDGIIYNTSVLSHSETPGLGAKCTGSFKDQFKMWNPQEKTLIVSKDGGDVDAITASTITSRAYTLAVANAVKAFMVLGQTPMPISEASQDEFLGCDGCEECSTNATEE